MPNSQDFVPIEEALNDLKAGKMIVLVDDEQRENEGDLVVAAEHATPEIINFMIRNGCGILNLAMSEKICDRLHLDVMGSPSAEGPSTPFTQKFDARYGITTGTSAFDRARTVAVAIADNATANDIIRGKGHMDGLRAKDGGVLVRAGHTEGSVDLARLAGLKEAAVIIEVMDTDGTMARMPYLREFAKQHQIKMCSIEDLIKFRRQRERLIQREFVVKLPTKFGEFDLIPYTSVVDSEPHLALCMGGVGIEANGVIAVQSEPILVRVHSQCLTGDILGSMLCDCGPQLHQAMAQVAQAKKGVVLYMRQEGRGIGLLPKLKAYKLQQEEKLDTIEANEALGFAPDLRQYGIGAQILYDLGIRNIRLLTNNALKVVGLDGYGLRITERVPIQIEPNQHNARYLKTKKDKFGHLLDELK